MHTYSIILSGFWLHEHLIISCFFPGTSWIPTCLPGRRPSEGHHKTIPLKLFHRNLLRSRLDGRPVNRQSIQVLMGCCYRIVKRLRASVLLLHLPVTWSLWQLLLRHHPPFMASMCTLLNHSHMLSYVFPFPPPSEFVVPRQSFPSLPS